MKDRVYFEFYRNFDEYPLSAGFYDSEILKNIEEGNSYYFHHPDNDEMEEYKVTRKSVGYCKGYTVLVAISIDNFTLEEFGLTKKPQRNKEMKCLIF